MNCDNLTRKQAVELFYKSLPLNGYGQKILEYLSMREGDLYSSRSLRYLDEEEGRIGDVIYGSDVVYVKGDFRGFLFGTRYDSMVEAGDEVKKGIPFKRFHFTKGLRTSHIIYIGDKISVYWSDRSGGSSHSAWPRPEHLTSWNFNRDALTESTFHGELTWSKFGIEGMLDVTDLICGRRDTFINWNTPPWEVLK